VTPRENWSLSVAPFSVCNRLFRPKMASSSLATPWRRASRTCEETVEQASRHGVEVDTVIQHEGAEKF